MNFSVLSRPISVLLYDGECAFCSWVVRFILIHERSDDLRFASLASQFARDLLSQRPELQSVDSVVWADLNEAGEPILFAIRSSAVIRIFSYLGSWWSTLQVFWILPRPVRDWVYDLVARHRRRILPLGNCVIVSEDFKERIQA